MNFISNGHRSPLELLLEAKGALPIPGLFWNISQTTQEKEKFHLVYEPSPEMRITLQGYEPLSTRDLRIITGFGELARELKVTYKCQGVGRPGFNGSAKYSIFDIEQDLLVLQPNPCKLEELVGLYDVGTLGHLTNCIERLACMLVSIEIFKVNEKTGRQRIVDSDIFTLASGILETSSIANISPDSLSVQLHPFIFKAMVWPIVEMDGLPLLSDNAFHMLYRIAFLLASGQEGKFKLEDLCSFIFDDEEAFSAQQREKEEATRKSIREIHSIKSWKVEEIGSEEYKFTRLTLPNSPTKSR